MPHTLGAEATLPLVWYLSNGDFCFAQFPHTNERDRHSTPPSFIIIPSLVEPPTPAVTLFDLATRLAPSCEVGGRCRSRDPQPRVVPGVALPGLPSFCPVSSKLKTRIARCVHLCGASLEMGRTARFSALLSSYIVERYKKDQCSHHLGQASHSCDALLDLATRLVPLREGWGVLICSRSCAQEPPSPSFYSLNFCTVIGVTCNMLISLGCPSRRYPIEGCDFPP
jgi:hypothetical protein